MTGLMRGYKIQQELRVVANSNLACNTIFRECYTATFLRNKEKLYRFDKEKPVYLILAIEEEITCKM